MPWVRARKDQLDFTGSPGHRQAGQCTVQRYRSEDRRCRKRTLAISHRFETAKL